MTESALQQQNRQKISTELVFERERRRSRKVRWLKRALPALAVLMIAGLAGKSLIGSMGGVSIDVAGSTIQDGKLIMANPRMAGYSADNRPYEMKAARAVQEIANDDVVDLQDIGARIPVGKNDWATVETARGRLVKSKNTMTIDSPAIVKTTDGMEARLKSAVIDIARGTLTTDDAVEIDLDGSQITADSMAVSNGGEVLVFEKRVKVLVEANRIKTAAAGEGNAEN
jgi:lipopolysaccharide export system protein LptC